ncbi:acetyl/propionyl/methylcrotonyl-CoA carboxylase subunit alpha [Microbacterium sp. RD1]|uniref:acetyl/propionyl/methylcrotonyl-CoA carboxylase subunit alpha n=1 Tax=Microbacterium sp. RD1 TaxID=3457313 RepID=UPI003FA5F7B2
MNSSSDSISFATVLVANRGEIACRVIRTLHSLGIRAVAVFSDADADALHVRLADAAVRLGPAPAAESYLDMAAIIAAARATGAQAIHPGYGFLAESAAFAEACAEAGIVFVGPGVEAIRTMGDKIAAKLAVQQRDVPTVPGVARPGMSDAELLEAAESVGYPLLIKPSAGGGGKGMHVVEQPAELVPGLQAARREAAASFGDDTLFLERYVSNPRHIEVQVLADQHGNVIHLGERECSLQRRHQKVIEEAPSPLLDAATRERIGQAACETARSVAYEGAGTVEFIVSAEHPDEFFFMEMNTRLQVEHPVTEEVTGIDLVEEQVRIAAGEPLRWTQSDVRIEGHSIEARVYAEDPQEGFLPTGGRVGAVRHPAGTGVRVDTSLYAGLQVSIDYDPMLAKIIATGPTREVALQRLVQALRDTAVFGFATNLEFLRLLLEIPEVRAGDLDTGLIARTVGQLSFAEASERELLEAALVLDAHSRRDAAAWSRRDGWRMGGLRAVRRYRLATSTGTHIVELVTQDDGGTAVVRDGTTLPARLTPGDGSSFTIGIDGWVRRVAAWVSGPGVELTVDGARFVFVEEAQSHRAESETASDPVIASPMPGTVVLLRAADGAHVDAGDPVLVVEAMKMEHVLTSPVAGTVRMRAVVGDRVARGQALAVIDTHAEAPEDVPA